MTTTTNGLTLFALLLALSVVRYGYAFVPVDRCLNGRQQRNRLIVSGGNGDNNDAPIIVEDDAYEPQYGVSFIGGDPCGSKYNSDPHDARVEKPGMPDSMKARIQALADQRMQKEKLDQEVRDS